jgi:hypothetical protein
VGQIRRRQFLFTAGALAVACSATTIPQSVLLRADRMIE